MASSFYTPGLGFNTGKLDENGNPILDTSRLGKFASGSFNFGKLGSINAGSAVSAVAKPIGGLLSQSMESKAGALMSGAADIVSQIPGPIGMFGGAALNVASGVTNALFGHKENTANIEATKAGTNSLLNFNSNYGSFDEIQGPTGIKNFTKSELGKQGLLSHHIDNLYAKLRELRQQALDLSQRNTIQNISNLQDELQRSLMANYASYGGFLSNGVVDWGIGLTEINSGGSHEENPYEGVQIGVDQQGIPNMVEEGEVVWDNNYVFSNRLKIPKYLLSKYGMRNKQGATFADYAKSVKDRRLERPNDPITRRTTNRQLEMLQEDQESLKQKLILRPIVTLGDLYWNAPLSDIYGLPLLG